jgi:hypothetical protein
MQGPHHLTTRGGGVPDWTEAVGAAGWAQVLSQALLGRGAAVMAAEG